MNYLSTIIIQNDAGGKEQLLHSIQSFFPDLKIDGYISQLENSNKILKGLQPNLAIIDLDGENEIGFQILNNLRRITFEIIFTSKQKDYALEAFRFSPIDYILKPLDFRALKNSIQKARRRIVEKRKLASFEKEHVKRDINNFLRISNTDGVRFLNLDKVVRFEADGVYTRIFVINEKSVLSSINLGKYEKILLDKSKGYKERFYRVHHKHLVNLSHVEQYMKNNQSVLLSDQTEIKVAQRRLAGFKRKMQD